MKRAYFQTDAIAKEFVVRCFNAGKYVELFHEHNYWKVMWV